ncbi:UNVERIFIED_ORG: hypothetical protein J2740_001700 [Rhizobium nepotum]|nr:hypothetical protein [Rhizobium nepotum]
MQLPIQNPKGFAQVLEADETRHSHAAAITFRHMGYDGSILSERGQRQMRKPDQLTHIRAGGRAKRQAEFPAPRIVRNEVCYREKLAINAQRNALAVRSLPDCSLTRERPPARAREAIEPIGRTGDRHASHTLKSPGRCCFG